jgi:tetratricopeptide (TPR) repeat protein
MVKKKLIFPYFGAFVLGLLLLPAGFSFAQERAPQQFSQRLQNGIRLYRESYWQEAAVEFQSAREIAVNTENWAEAYYWFIMARLAVPDYSTILLDMDELEKKAPGTIYSMDIVYHRGRVFYQMGEYDRALTQFNQYSDAISSGVDKNADRRAAAYFWTGETLYSLRQYQDAEKFYNQIISGYPDSPKVTISSYRLELIRQKKIEEELLALLKLSHEEMLRLNEDYQWKINNYDQAVSAYQKRISEPMNDSDTRMIDLERTNIELRQRLEEARDKGRVLEARLVNYEALEALYNLSTDSHGGSR